jgi:hypothetical protein
MVAQARLHRAADSVSNAGPAQDECRSSGLSASERNQPIGLIEATKRKTE